MPHDVFEAERYELREPVPYRFHVTRREWLESVGAGLLVLAIAPSAGAQEHQSSSNALQARIHVGEDGRITILSGKIEEGQGPRTELAIAAAEELRVPVEAIDVSLADTDLVPNDGITAGSRTTPGTVPLVRRAAAFTRELLIDAAAQNLGVSRDRLKISDGSVHLAGSDKRYTYADLAKSAEIAKAYSQNPPADVHVTQAENWSVLGKAKVRVNGDRIVTGGHKYPSDIQREGMLYGSILRPPSYGATLVSLNADTAKSLERVTVVRDGEFVGCTAPTSFEARKAVEALAASAQWKEKQHPSSDNLFEHLKEHARPEETGGRNRPKTTGDVEAALAGAKARYKAVYHAAYIQHVPMEPRAAVAEWNDGKLTVWTGTSHPFGVRDELAEVFRIPAMRVRVIVPDMGGGFGGKHTGEAAIEAARLSREVKRPVSLRWTRAEEFTWAYCRPAALIEVEAALDEKGQIAAWDFANYNAGGSGIDTPYAVANARIRFVASESPLRQGSYRALASTANNFARECSIDELAEAAGVDPLEFRLTNLQNDRIAAVLKAAAEKFGWPERRKVKSANRGIGLACGTEKNSVVAACVEVELDRATGAPKLLEICQAFECGAILNPAGLQAQVEGSILMALGGALREEILFADGKVKNPRFSSYRVPRFKDKPKIDVVLVDRKDYAPSGAGETPMIVVLPAMANAIFAINGQRIRKAPFGTLKV